MIHDLDESIKKLLIQKVPVDITAIDISFDTPDEKWVATIAKPTINCFLYDIRENRELRSNQRVYARDTMAVSETRAPVYIDLSYQLSVWTSAIADEHRLLGTLLSTLIRYPVFPKDVLTGVIQDQVTAPHGWIAFGERTPNAWDFWGGFDGRLKAALSYVVTIAVTASDVISLNVVTQKVIKITG